MNIGDMSLGSFLVTLSSLAATVGNDFVHVYCLEYFISSCQIIKLKIYNSNVSLGTDDFLNLLLANH